MKWGTATVFGLLELFTLLSFIKSDSRIMQKIYFRVIAWTIPASWMLNFILFIFGLVSATTKTSSLNLLLDTYDAFNVSYTNFVAKFVGMALSYSGVTALVEFGAWGLRNKVVKFYRWDQQQWWNYDPADAPGNFPAQLGDYYDAVPSSDDDAF